MKTQFYGILLICGLFAAGGTCVVSDVARGGTYSCYWQFADGLGNNCMTLAAGDMDNDGDDDIVGKYGQTGWVGWFENIGGEFAVHGEHPEVFNFELIYTGYTGYTLFVADMDGDGDTDVVGAGPHPTLSKTVPCWWENSSNGTSWTSHMIYDPVGTPSWVEPADIDGDGDMDVAVAEWNKVLWVKLNNGAYVNSYTLDSPGSWNCWCAHPAQLDGDTELEIVGTWYYGSYMNKQVCIYQTGSGSNIVLATNQMTGPWTAWALDFDGDGDLDVAASGSSGVRVWKNNGSSWSLFLNDSAVVATSFRSADVDQDGDDELILAGHARVGTFSSSSWTVTNVGTSSWPMGTWSTTGCGIGDFDGDTYADVVHPDAAGWGWWTLP